MIVVEPFDTPVTTPVKEPTDAIPELLLVHVPPDDALASVVVKPTHTLVVPVIAAGSGLIVTVVLALAVQPLVLVTISEDEYVPDAV